MCAVAQPPTKNSISNPVRLLARLALIVAGMAGPGCDAATGVSIVADGNDVVVDRASVTVTRGGRPVLQVLARDIGVKKGVASYQMQLGMFDIHEDGDAFVFGEELRLHADNDGDADGGVAFDVLDGDTILATGSVRESDSGLLLQIDASSARNRVIVATSCHPEHHFLGLGAQTHDVDHRGQIVPLWVSEQGVGRSNNDELPPRWETQGLRHTSPVPMPAFVRSDAVAVVVDTSAFARFDLCATDSSRASFEVWEPHARIRVFARDNVKHAQQAMTWFLGRPRLLPPWALAPWNDAILSGDDVEAFAAFLRAEQIPSSVLWSDDAQGGHFSADTFQLGKDWHLDPLRYPDYPGLVQRLKSAGFGHQLYFNTLAADGADVFAEVTAAGHDVRNSSTGESAVFGITDPNAPAAVLLDLTNPAARTWMKQEHLQPALTQGASGWMADFGEWMPVNDIAVASGEDPALLHNRYPELWQSLNREALQEANVDDDSVVVARSGHLGSPPLVDVLWLSEQQASFDDNDGLPTIMAMGIGAATTGFSMITQNIGGARSSIDEPSTQELWFRSTELGAFMPLMRTHHGNRPSLNHNLRSDAESTAHYKRYAEIHVRLYPYLRALMIAATGSDDDVGAGLGPLPLWIPLPLLYPADDVWAVKDQVLLGPSLLLAPVVVEGAVSRSVQLPAGRWVAFALPGAPPGSLGLSRAEFIGPTTLRVPAAQGEIPVFMPAGGIVPLTALPAQTLRDVDDEALADLSSTRGDRVVVIALGADGVFVEEDGSSYVLEGAGTELPAGLDDDGGLEVVGNQQVSGAPGFTLTLSDHPSTRTTRLLFR